MEIISLSYEHTVEIGEKIGNFLKKGSIVCIKGDLGAGKTALTRGICRSFGVFDVSSPTFVIFHVYEGDLPIYHFDVYRINEDELEDIGYEEYFYDDGITIIEWADKLKRIYPKECLEIDIRNIAENQRLIKINPVGQNYEYIKDVAFL